MLGYAPPDADDDVPVPCRIRVRARYALPPELPDDPPDDGLASADQAILQAWTRCERARCTLPPRRAMPRRSLG